MMFYLKTEAPTTSITPLLKRYMNMISYRYYNLNLDKYLKNNYNLSLYQALNEINNYVRANNVQKDGIQIYFDKNRIINNHKLEEIVELLEYGNLDISSPKLISKLLSKSFNMLSYDLGGI